MIKDLSVLKLPEKTKLLFNTPFNVGGVGANLARSLVTVNIDLKGDEKAVQQSRAKYPAAIKALRGMKFFSALESVQCFVGFSNDEFDDIAILKGASFPLSKPIDYGTPSEIFDKRGKVIAVDNYDTKNIWANFKDPLIRDLRCIFRADESERYNEHFLDDFKVSQLEVLVSPHFTFLY
jgi:hypothetical protein